MAKLIRRAIPIGAIGEFITPQNPPTPGSKLNQIQKLNLSCKDTKNKDIPYKELRESFDIIRVVNVIIKMKTKQIILTSFLAWSGSLSNSYGFRYTTKYRHRQFLYKPVTSLAISLLFFSFVSQHFNSNVYWDCFFAFAIFFFAVSRNLQHSSCIYPAVHFPPFVLTLKECE